MAAISASMVKELRERTGLGMLECKKALAETDGDVDKAIEELRKKSGMKAAKKAGRTAAEGVVVVKVADDASKAMLVEVNSETDFAAKNEDFLAFANKVAEEAFASGSTDVAGLLDAEREALVQKVGENISPRRAVALEGAVVGSYVHSNNRIGAIVVLSGGSAELAKDIAMHATAVNPRVLRPEDMAEEELEKEKEIIKAQPDMEGKPAEIVEKMMGGRIKKFLKENSMTEQPFVKNPELTVGQLAKEGGAEIVSFVRLEVGEGIEVEETDFAAEVAAQLAGDA
ncbi:elongation factor Ts [Oleiphilus sp. HI0009]|nr:MULTISPECIES: translation elongation factor Ts [unclassified Oleiphilus]KZX78324.1 elongation factor Ts [Oleiphilus sp. HI0009]MCH2159433.1 translation elongation factor Ts [Oleiphilaceae bacterium]KZX78973.1 elongation factor Ts [Oleiphilus sp. HI0009]KZY66011.1 elongation factor Ts [Oleiphilus sp. HI0066]KZY67672.1 elongation factor Ts [Oleiphilus sp. HI0067]